MTSIIQQLTQDLGSVEWGGRSDILVNLCDFLQGELGVHNFILMLLF